MSTLWIFLLTALLLEALLRSVAWFRRPGTYSPNTGRPIISVYGDSFVLGFGVSQEYTFPSQFARLLKVSGRTESIVNRGFDNIGSFELLGKIETDIQKEAHPALVIVMVGAADYWTSGTISAHQRIHSPLKLVNLLTLLYEKHREREHQNKLRTEIEETLPRIWTQADRHFAMGAIELFRNLSSERARQEFVLGVDAEETDCLNRYGLLFLLLRDGAYREFDLAIGSFEKLCGKDGLAANLHAQKLENTGRYLEASTYRAYEKNILEKYKHPSLRPFLETALPYNDREAVGRNLENNFLEIAATWSRIGVSVLFLTYPVIDEWTMWKEGQTIANRTLRRLSRDHRIRLLDLDKAFPSQKDHRKRLFQPLEIGVHCNEAGYRLIAEKIAHELLP